MPVEIQLLLLRGIHTAVFVVEVAAILYMIWRGWRGWRGPLDRWCLLAVLLTAGTGLGLLLNDGDCIFHTWAEAAAGEEDVSDIFLPIAAARLIFPVSLPFVTLGYILLARRWWRERRGAAR